MLLFIVLACDTETDCTLIGCANTLHLTVETGGVPLSVFSGEITVDGTTFTVDCPSGTSSPEVSCGDGELSIFLPDGVGGGEVTWSLNSPPSGDTGATGQSGGGTFTPDWTTSQPNGPECGPTCYSAEGALELFENP